MANKNTQIIGASIGLVAYHIGLHYLAGILGYTGQQAVYFVSIGLFIGYFVFLKYLQKQY